MSGLLGMLGASHPAKEAKPKKKKKKAAQKKAASKSSTSSRTAGARPRKTTARPPTSTPSSAPSRKAATATPSVAAKQGGASLRKRAAPCKSPAPASVPKRHKPNIPVDRTSYGLGLNPLALPKGFKGRNVVYKGHRILASKKLFYAGETFLIVGAVWFQDYKEETKVRFQLWHSKMQFGLSILPEDLKIGKKDLSALARAMLKNAGR